MRKIIFLIKYELLTQNPFPYVILIASIAIATIYFPVLHTSKELIFQVFQGASQLNDKEIVTSIYISSLIALKGFYDDFKYEIFIPWLALSISASYGLSISSSLKRERLRFIFSLPIGRTKYILTKIIITTLMLYLLFHFTLYALLYLRFKIMSIAFLFPLAFFRDFLIISSISIFTAILSRNELITTFSGLIGWIFNNFVFANIFVSGESYSLMLQAEPFYSMNLLNEIMNFLDDPINASRLGLSKDLIPTAITLNNLSLIYTLILSATLILLSIITFERGDIG